MVSMSIVFWTTIFLCCKAGHSWMTMIPPSRRILASSSKGIQAAASEGQSEEEPDLFDYFDPLLSPHAYPDGISPQSKPQSSIDEDVVTQTTKPSSSKMEVLGLDKYHSNQQQSSSPSPEKQSPPQFTGGGGGGEKEEPDLFDYFDPLSSPHEYPNGIHKPASLAPPKPLQEDDRYDPLKFSNAKAATSDSASASASATGSGSGSGKIGILLMDHGSRNSGSNQRLQKLAELYQLTMADENVVIRAAHMEIASPNIPEGLQSLLQEGVDEIVCHPYFLSPGRHVVEDIPEIIAAAKVSLDIKVPVITTAPLGSNTQLMLGAIHSSVREHSVILRSQKEN